MATEVRLRRGTAAEHEVFVGAPAEVTVDTTNNTLRVHDGETLGGHETMPRGILPSPIVPDTFLQAKADGSGYQAVDDEQMLNALGIPAGKPTADPATPITGSLLSGAMLAAGAIVEQGENANGSYWRWESGLQVCTLSISLGPANAAGNGTTSNPWRTADLNLQLPAAFVGDPVITATAERLMPTAAEAVVGAYLRKSIGSSEWRIQAWAAIPDGGDVVAYVTAIGRWK